MSTPNLIGLTGLAGSGKDTVAALLSMRGYRRYAFGDAVRKEVAEIVQQAQMNAARNAPLELPVEWGYSPLEVVLYSALEEVWEKPTPAYMRQILQRHGTEYRRAQDPDYWVKQFEEWYRWYAGMLFDPDARLPVVITDVRFLNEAAIIRELGGVVWRVVRPGTAVMEHISETEQNQIEVDAELSNDSSIMDLAEKVKGLLT